MEVSVSDTGCGIAPDRLASVLDPFAQAQEQGRAADFSAGTGLGLSIAKLIIDQHGQDISVSSENGETCFAFTLKKAAKPAAKKAQEAAV